MKTHLTLKSSNSKTGPIPVSTSSRDSCPPDCAMRAECYADAGPLALHWSAVTRAERGDDWPVFVSKIAALPDAGKPLMERWLVSPDPDIGWIMRENLKKNRLVRMDARKVGMLRVEVEIIDIEHKTCDNTT
jgi:hypothetical protein